LRLQLRNTIDRLLSFLLKSFLATAHRVVYFSGAKLYVLEQNQMQITAIYLRYTDNRLLILSRSSGLWPVAQLYVDIQRRRGKAPWVLRT